MVLIRGLLIGLPCLLVALLGAAFISTSFLSIEKKNEMSIGSIGEPANLNPIQSADSASSQVAGFIFEGLLKYDENLEIAGELAESWELSQRTTFFFPTPETAQAARAHLEAAKERWPDWDIRGVEVLENRLELDLSVPGMASSQAVAEWIRGFQPLPISRIRLEKKDAGVRAFLQEFAKGSDHPWIREWFEFDSAAEISTLESAAQLVESLTGKAPADTLNASVIEELPFLAEPLVRFHLKRGVQWHDGAPFTARDVLFTYNAIMDERVASPRKPDFDLIQSVTAEDDFTVSVRYRKPYSPALNSWGMSIIPAHLLENIPPADWADGFNRRPIGTGPYQFDEWKTNEYVRVRKNAHYHQPGPWLDSVVMRVLPDPLTLRLAFETKQTDFWGVSPWAMKTFQNDERFELFSAPGNQYSYIAWNLRRPLFQDVRVRRALAHAVNVQAMIDYIIYGRGVRSTGIYAPQMWFFNKNVQPLAYDPEKAKQLLQEAGWKPGADGILAKDGKRMSFTIITNNGNEERKDIATLVQDNLRHIGVEVKIELYEWAVFLTKFVNKGDFDAVVLGWTIGVDYDQYQIWHSSQSGEQQLNFIGYNNPKVDQLLDALRQEFDREKIIELAGEIQETIYEDQPYLFLFVPEITSVLWAGSYRIYRPAADGFIDTPIEMTKAGWSYYMPWFYRPEYKDLLPQ